MSGQPVELVQREGGELVEATLLDGLTAKDLLVVERAWAPTRAGLIAELLKRGVPRPEWPQSVHWDWSRKAPELHLLQASGFGIVTGSEWQGALMTKTAACVARLKDDSGKPLVYVDFLEAAPWNWRVKPLGQVGRFKGVGALLFREAVLQSMREGFHGRVGLHSLPQAESFYDQECGMTRVAPDPKKQNLVYFEFTRQQAQRFLQKGSKP